MMNRKANAVRIRGDKREVRIAGTTIVFSVELPFGFTGAARNRSTSYGGTIPLNGR
jgi:hypothetical protein